MKKYLLPIICLAVNLASCTLPGEEWNLAAFLNEPIKVNFKPGQIAQPISLDKIPGATVILLPVKSTMGAGMGEEVVTKEFLQKLTARHKQVKLVSDEQASKLFTDLDLWDAYYEGLLENYYQTAINLGVLLELYRPLKPDYLMGVTADYTFARPTPPRTVVFFIHVQVWDVRDGRLVWEGQADGQDVSDNLEWDAEVVQDVVSQVCKNFVEHM